jgi:hypothetical protein
MIPNNYNTHQYISTDQNNVIVKFEPRTFTPNTSTYLVEPNNSAEFDNIINEDSSDSCERRCCVCDDKATGVHYGIVTCESCKVRIADK